ncbi:sensor of ECF-type sigma factor [Winogradskyella bathintestinalis]|uniref:Sensor of ECF-type sigma factor n=1 Tax=Winogradskyella bathintestinalis TaxID=3035208 RepID=A0ABT7ZTM6_9FLAO|nr:sensor of ECF-type sigma factor [Winogradskyella bathintestinalis]MDN3492311.1 sensor of ECF-type sigma factor [Winogradskyella bathintestinalis]
MKTLYTFIIILFISSSVFAQRLDREKLKALKIAHITEQLDLSKEEAQKFWPIYNANEDKKDNLRQASKTSRKDKSPEELSESEAKSLLLKMEKIEKDKLELQSSLLNELFKILPATKIIKLYQAERSFKHKMFEEYKKRHANNGRKN